MGDTREVCKICFRSTSHKPNPTLTPESKASVDPGGKRKKCSACHQEWAPIRVAKELGGGPTKWVRIRPRPKIPASIDFQICKNIQGKVECPKGQDCSYAHSRIELQLWNKDRDKEPRPAPHINGPYQYTLCKHMINAGACPYTQRCTFAHSEEELASWLRVQGQVTTNGVYTGAGYLLGSGNEFRCEICNLSCTSKKQLDDHMSGSKHKQQVAVRSSGGFSSYIASTPAQNVGRNLSLRRRPLLSFPIHGYKLCMHNQAGRRCVYGDYCTFAHSQPELEEWNRQLKEPHHVFKSPGGGVIKQSNYQNYPPESHGVNAVGIGGTDGMGNPGLFGGGVERKMPEVFGSHSGLDDFDDELPDVEDRDFASMLRARVTAEQKQKNEVQGFEVGRG